MSLQRGRGLLALPSSLRTSLLHYLYPTSPSRRCLSTQPPEQPRRDSKVLKDNLWTSPSISIQPPSNPFATPTLNYSYEPTQHKTANSFLLDKPPSFAYSALEFYNHAVNHYLPEVCILGCSNAGKSTIINALLGTTLARSSSHPGSTRAMNAYETGPVAHRKVIRNVNAKKPGKIDFTRSMVVMDTPGYGFNSIKEWGVQVEVYLKRRTMLRGVVLLLRSDVPLTNWDVEVLKWLSEIGKKTTIMLTRADKCGEWDNMCVERYAQIQEHLPRTRKGEMTGEWVPTVYITAAGMKSSPLKKEATKQPKTKGKNVAYRDQAGMAGARIALLKLAGILEDEGATEDDGTNPEPWVGKTVSWDNIPVKGASNG